MHGTGACLKCLFRPVQRDLLRLTKTHDAQEMTPNLGPFPWRRTSVEDEATGQQPIEVGHSLLQTSSPDVARVTAGSAVDMDAS